MIIISTKLIKLNISHLFTPNKFSCLKSKVIKLSKNNIVSYIQSNRKLERDDILKVLQISSFSDDEIKKSYDKLILNSVDNDNSVSLNAGFRKLLSESNVVIKNIDENTNDKIKNAISQIAGENGSTLTYEIYKKNTRLLGEKLDNRLLPIAGSFLLTGTSIGIIIPCMPILIKTLEIPSSQFGFVVAAFGLSKLLGNIPSGYLVDVYGRKPALVGGLGLCAIGIGGVGLTLIPTLGTPWLLCCRLVTGLGVSFFIAGAQMYVNDISTTLNRTRSLAPVMASFQAGTAFGPALGGILIETIGLTTTYSVVGGLFCVLALGNHFFLNETMKKPQISAKSIENGVVGSFYSSFASWKTLLKEKKIRDVVLLNGAYWVALAGTQMTLLPIHMISSQFNMGATEIGATFALMSIVSVITSQPVAFLSDRYGKVETTIFGSALVGLSIVSIPFATNFTELLLILAPLALGSTAISSAPQAYMLDLCSPKDRSQGLALLRTGGDIGLLLGASFSGLFADFTSIPVTIETNGALILTAMLLFSYRFRNTINFSVKK